MAAPAYRSLWRDPEHGLVAGVCAGLAERIGVDPLLLRAAFVAATAAGGVGIVAYGVLWLLLPAVGEDRAPLRGLRKRAPGSWRTAAGVALLTLSGLLVLRQLGLWFSDAIVWPVVLAAAGVALAWRLAGPGPDSATEEPEAADADAPAAIQRRRALRGAYGGGFGVALIVGAALLFLYANGLLAGLGDLVLTVVVVVAAVGLILAPFWWRLVRSLSAERAARIRSQERTEVSAHLHDSVLQTLALVQRQAADPRAVSALARRQERELRAWLQDRDAPGADESLAGALTAAAEEVEAAHGVGVDVVTVGDAALDDHTRALTAAAREALVNAAKFAGDAGPVSLYAEADGERLQVFVRDRGPGFDPEATPADRRGVRDSIVGRMARHGGHAAIRPAPGRGTEVELTLERPR
ncbi:MAG TPA: PspC domain-containing protein [Solirubrobacteraceae bacterium]|nr:PspC domain-containing protein [Solirubrobacteraceae bacterium]